MAIPKFTLAALLMSVSPLALAQTPPAVPAPTGAAVTAPTAAVTAPAPVPMVTPADKPTGTAAVAPAGSAPTASASAASSAAVVAATPDVQQKLTARLQAAGYTNVKVMPESFLIQATDKSGSPVSIFLDRGNMVVFTTADAMTSPDGAKGPEAPAAGIFATIPANEDLSSKLIGLDIHNASNEKIGTIKDVAFGSKGVKAYIVGVGGFLGMGDHYVAILPSAIKIGFDSTDKKWHATMNTTAAELKAAPEYKYASNT